MAYLSMRDLVSACWPQVISKSGLKEGGSQRLRTYEIVKIYVDLRRQSVLKCNLKFFTGKNSFVYNGKGHSYIHCFYFATKAATSIGQSKSATNILENIFLIVSWLMGVVVFSIFVSDIEQIVGNYKINALTYRKQLDAVKTYLRIHKVPKKVQVQY